MVCIALSTPNSIDYENALECLRVRRSRCIPTIVWPVSLLPSHTYQFSPTKPLPPPPPSQVHPIPVRSNARATKLTIISPSAAGALKTDLTNSASCRRRRSSRPVIYFNVRQFASRSVFVTDPWTQIRRRRRSTVDRRRRPPPAASARLVRSFRWTSARARRARGEPVPSVTVSYSAFVNARDRSSLPRVT